MSTFHAQHRCTAPAQPCRSLPVRQFGFTLIEISLATLIGGILILGLSGAVFQTLNAWDIVRDRQAALEVGHFALHRMTRAVLRTRHLLVPKRNEIATLWDESDHDVLAVTMDPELDRDRDGDADADNDGDGLVDEDVPGDMTNDNAPGIYLIDDNNDTLVDVPAIFPRDDDEDGTVLIDNSDEDANDLLDNDEDGSYGEDLPADMNGDGAPGIAGVDDDGDGNTDEGSVEDDDEDGTANEDWYDAVVYYLNGTDLVERMPDLDPVDGRDYTERTIAENVSSLRVQRSESVQGRRPMVTLTLELTTGLGEAVVLSAQVRQGGAL